MSSKDVRSNLFRKQAKEARATDEQLDRLIQVTTKKSWIVLVTITIILMVIVLWGIFGSIPIRVHGEGILIAEDGGVYSAMAPVSSGRIVRIAVTPGEEVKKGGLIAELEVPELEKQLANEKDYLKNLQQKYDELEKMSKTEIEIRQKKLVEQNAILQKTIDDETKKLKFIDTYLKAKREGHRRGFISKEHLMTTIRDFYSTKQAIQQNLDRIKQNQINEADFIDQWKQRLRDLKLKVDEQANEVASIQAKLAIAKEIRSPVTGMVIALEVSIGDEVQEGDVIASIASKAHTLEGVVFIPADDGKRVKSDMRALLSPTTVKKEEYGSMIGSVISVSAFPATPQAIESIVQNEELVKRFSENGAPIAVRVRLEKNKATVSGYKWSSPDGPPQKITPGTLITAMITVRKQAPVTLIIPTLKKLLGS